MAILSTPLESMYGNIKHTIRKHVWEDKAHHQKARMAILSTPLESMYGNIKHTIRKHVWQY